jgi:hypothetical protein
MTKLIHTLERVLDFLAPPAMPRWKFKIKLLFLFVSLHWMVKIKLNINPCIYIVSSYFSNLVSLRPANMKSYLSV